jgi:hypothetical protein
MKTNQIVAVAGVLSIFLFFAGARAADITATGSGNWSSTNADAPWPNGIAPGSNDDAYIASPFSVTVDTNVTVQYIYGSGTVTVAPNMTLNILGDAGAAYGTAQLNTLNATAAGCSVIYSGNPFWAKQCNYYNLEFCNTNYVDPYPPYDPVQKFNNFSSSLGPTAMTIAGNMTVIGYTAVQQGADITIVWDCSTANLTVTSNTVLGGLMEDLDGALGSNSFGGNFTVTAPTGDWELGDVITWGVGGSLTNYGKINGTAYASISFDGTGNIAGNPITIPTLTINGTYDIATTITLTTNTPALNGTLVFDLANPGKFVFPDYVGTSFYYAGNLTVIDGGAPPAPGGYYQFFNAPSFGGGFNTTSYPNLPAGLSWNDNLYSDGSISVSGGIIGAPALALTGSGGVLTLSWDSATYSGYHVVTTTNLAGPTVTWADTGSGTVSPYTTPINSTNGAVFFRLSNP